MAIIWAPQNRTYYIGEEVIRGRNDYKGTIMLDLEDPNCKAYGNIPIAALVEHLNTIEGVTASYEPPKVRIPVPKNIGAVITLGSLVLVTRVNLSTNGTSRNTWIQRGNPVVNYTDEDIDYYLNNREAYPYAKVLSEGVEL